MSLAPTTPGTARKGSGASRTPTASSSLPPIPGPSPAYLGGTRSRHAVYGADDRVVLDLGSRVWKAGFSGESKPRVVATVRQLCGGTDDALRMLQGEDALVKVTEEEHEQREMVLRERIANGLRCVYFQHLMVDPKQRKVVVLEDALVPHSFKAAVATALFDNLGVPSVSFCSASLCSLMSCGTLTGLVVDIGHLETCVTPVFASRPLFPFVRSTPRAGASVTRRLRSLLLKHARYLPTASVTTGPPVADARSPSSSSLPPELLSVETVEQIKTRLLLPVAHHPEPSTGEYSPSDLVYPLPSASSATNPSLGTLPQGSIVIPGSARHIAAEVLFEEASDTDGEDDECDSVPNAILRAVERLPMDLRRPMVSSIVVTGGGAMLPNFTDRLGWELQRRLGSGADSDHRKRRRRRSPFQRIIALARDVAILNGTASSDNARAGSAQGSAAAFSPHLLAWLGGSLAGSIRTGGTEVVKDQWRAAVEEEAVGAGDPLLAKEDEQQLKQRRGVRKACALVPDWTRLPIAA